MNIKMAVGKALQKLRKARELTQEDFGEGSSRTYVSTVERGIFSPTVEKLDTFGRIMNIHPVTLVVAAYLEYEPKTSLQDILDRVSKELQQLFLVCTVGLVVTKT